MEMISWMDQLKSFIEKHERARDLDLRDANLANADLSSLCADGLNLSAANLFNAILRETHLGSCSFQHAHLEDSDWSNATARMCVLDSAFAAGARFDGARLEDSSARGADFTGASLRGAWLTDTYFDRAVLREAALTNVQGDGVEFRGADLRGARLTGAKLDEADFRGADLRGADLSGGRFHAADFRGAILDDALMTGADLEGALFDKEPVREAESTRVAGDSRSAPDALLAALQKALSELPGALESPDTRLAGLMSELQRVINEPGAIPPTEAVAAAGESAEQISKKLQSLIAVLDSTADQPPEEWKAWLEPLVKLVEAGQSFDINALIKELSLKVRAAPPAARRQNGARQKPSAPAYSGARRRRKRSARR
jgi:uncharacterized protein YjbI with pentapeptide repeats